MTPRRYQDRAKSGRVCGGELWTIVYLMTASFVVGIVKSVQRRKLFVSSVLKPNTDYTDY
jgi:hypothetical protein